MLSRFFHGYHWVRQALTAVFASLHLGAPVHRHAALVAARDLFGIGLTGASPLGRLRVALGVLGRLWSVRERFAGGGARGAVGRQHESAAFSRAPPRRDECA